MATTFEKRVSYISPSAVSLHSSLGQQTKEMENEMEKSNSESQRNSITCSISSHI